MKALMAFLNILSKRREKYIFLCKRFLKNIEKMNESKVKYYNSIHGLLNNFKFCAFLFFFFASDSRKTSAYSNIVNKLLLEIQTKKKIFLIELL